MNEDASLKTLITEHFGEAAYTGGILNRAYISTIVFENEEKLALLNSFVHPATISAAEQWMQQQNTAYVIKDRSIIIQTGSKE